MSKITSTRSFQSVLGSAQERREECQEWMDGMTELEYSCNENAVFCFVETEDSTSVKMLRFATTADMEEEMGLLVPEIGNQRVYEPVCA